MKSDLQMTLKSFGDTSKLLESSDHWKKDSTWCRAWCSQNEVAPTVPRRWTAREEGGSKVHGLVTSVFRGQADFEALPVGCLGPAPATHTSAAIPLLSASNSDTRAHKDEWDPHRCAGEGRRAGLSETAQERFKASRSTVYRSHWLLLVFWLATCHLKIA